MTVTIGIDGGRGSDEALARLAQVRLEIERHETEIWCLTREADELRAQIRLWNAKAPAVGSPA